jgi:hypothetical protein
MQLLNATSFTHASPRQYRIAGRLTSRGGRALGGEVAGRYLQRDGAIDELVVERGIEPSEERVGPALIMTLLLELPKTRGYFRPLADQPSMEQALWMTIRDSRPPLQWLQRAIGVLRERQKFRRKAPDK